MPVFKIEITSGEFWIDDNGILWSRILLLDGCRFTLVEAKKHINICLIVSKGKKRPFALDLGILDKTIDPEVIDYLTTEKKLAATKSAQAIITNSLPGWLMATEFSKNHPYDFPTKIFTKKDIALEWLQSFL